MDKPELVADVLLAKGAESSNLDLRRLISPQKMRQVERALWERLFTKVLDQNEGVVVGGRLETAFESLGKDTQEAIWGQSPQMLAKIRRFVKAANTVNLNKSMMSPVSAQGSSLLAFGQFAGATAAGTKAANAVLNLDPFGFVISIGGGATTLVAPAIMARIITSPGSIEVATKAFQTQAGTKLGRELAYRLIMQATAQSAKPSASSNPSGGLASSHRPTILGYRQ